MCYNCVVVSASNSEQRWPYLQLRTLGFQSAQRTARSAPWCLSVGLGRDRTSTGSCSVASSSLGCWLFLWLEVWVLLQWLDWCSLCSATRLDNYYSDSVPYMVCKLSELLCLSRSAGLVIHVHTAVNIVVYRVFTCCFVTFLSCTSDVDLSVVIQAMVSHFVCSHFIGVACCEKTCD